MAAALSFETEIRDAMVTLDLALKGADAADAMLEAHAKGKASLETINFPREEGLLREAARLMEDWQSRIGRLLSELDEATAAAHLRFERLFDVNAGEETRPPLHRRFALSRPTPETILAEIKGLLVISASLDQTLKGLRPLVMRRQKACEGHLVRIIERRRNLDFRIEEAQRHVDALKPKIAARSQRIGKVLSTERAAAIEENHEALVAEQQALIAKQAELLPERQTLRRLIPTYEGFVENLNAQVRVLNLMKAKLDTDIEQRIAIMKAVLASSTALPDALPPAVTGLIEAYDNNPVAGYKVEERKARADAAFSRPPHKWRGEVVDDNPGGANVEAASEAN
jgi:hypothetical protein